MGNTLPAGDFVYGRFRTDLPAVANHSPELMYPSFLTTRCSRNYENPNSVSKAEF